MSFAGSYLTRLSDKRPDAAIDAAVRQAIALAEDLFKPDKFTGTWSVGGLGITTIRPKDIAATNQSSGLQGGVAGSGAWGVTAVTASTWTNWVSLNVDDRAYQVVTGIFNKTPQPYITNIKPFLNGQDMPIISVEEMHVWEEQKAYFTNPYIVSPANKHQIQVWSPVTLAGVPSEQIGLMGYIIGKRAYLIQE